MKIVKKLIPLVFFSLSACVIADAEQATEIAVYRNPNCGCCSKWMAYLQDNQFKVKDFVSNDVASKKIEVGVPNNMASCHTALVNGYVIEGHVPAADIRKLLKLKPKVIGIAVPGMPIGTPGMEMGKSQDPYQVMTFDSDNKHEVFTNYKGQK